MLSPQMIYMLIVFAFALLFIYMILRITIKKQTKEK